jgi:ABC-type sugar transport system ATPase subunit
MVDESHPGDDALIEARDLQRHFGGIAALRGASLVVRTGTIHALVGENGARKSTALGAIAGRLHIDTGSITIAGRDATRMTPLDTQAIGLAANYHQLTIIPGMTACADVFLSYTPVQTGFVKSSTMRARYRALCARVGVSIPPEARAGNLWVADRQMLEIMRAVESGARIILFDESTSSLVQAERDTLFRLMRELRANGVTMVLVSHNLNEVLAISDEITVFRNGRTVRIAPAAEWTRETLLAAMLGQAAPDLMASRRAAKRAAGDARPVIRIDRAADCGASRPTMGAARLVGRRL